jgi:peroxiredoxin
MAPDFQLPVLHGQQRVQLATFRGQKPVALIFGSYT